MIWLFYRPFPLTFVPRGSAVVLSDNDELAQVDGWQLSEGGVSAVILTALNSGHFTDPATYGLYLDGLRTRLVQKGITPLGIMVSEECDDRINNPNDMGGWPCFANMDPWLRKQLIRDRLTTFYGMVKARWPFTATVAVETKWNDDHAFGVGLWYPPPGNVDVLGVDAYLHSGAWAPLGVPITPPLDSSDSPAMREKFRIEVAGMIEGLDVPGYPRWRGAASFGKPLLLVGQGFKSRGEGMWAVPPSPVQLGWWYDLACRVPKVVALGWFCVQSAPSVIGLDGLPEQAAAVRMLWQQNQG